jgi:D-sedoheptulose 7-phosphate isomerase
MSSGAIASVSLTEYLRASSDLLSQSASYFADDRIERAVKLIGETLRADLPLLVCGNGGSAADAQHIAGELVGRFLRERRALNVICLSSNPSVLTAWANDFGYEGIFARQVEAHGQSGGVLLAISTSGNSPNVVAAAQTAARMRLPVIALTGAGGGALAALSDVLFDVPSTRTPLIQQVHVCLYHYLCDRVEALVSE